jgi:hypothetical protein
VGWGPPRYDPQMALTCDRPSSAVLGYYREQCDRSDEVLASVHDHMFLGRAVRFTWITRRARPDSVGSTEDIRRVPRTVLLEHYARRNPGRLDPRSAHIGRPAESGYPKRPIVPGQAGNVSQLTPEALVTWSRAAARRQ